MSIYTDLAATAKHAPDNLVPDHVRQVMWQAEQQYTILLCLRYAEKLVIERRGAEDGLMESTVSFEITFSDDEEKSEFLRFVLDLGD